MSDWETMKDRFEEIAKKVKPIQCGEVGIWYDNAGHYCDVIWLTTNAYFHPTDHKEVMALVDLDDNLFGFKVDATPWFDNVKNAYTTINLRTKLVSYRRVDTSIFDTEKQPDNPIAKGVINVRYDSAEHSFDVFWLNTDRRYIETENRHLLGAVDSNGILCGFKVINIDQLSDDEYGLVNARLKTKMTEKAA